MNLELHRDPRAFAELQPEWNALLERSVCRAPFLRAEYQQAWWEHRGGGEWPQAELLLLAARDQAGRLVGVAPLFAAPNAERRPALLAVGSHEISDYLDLIVAHPDLDAFAAALLDRLAWPDMPAWQTLDLYNLPAASPTRAALTRAALARGWSAAERPLQQTPAIRLPSSWDAYLDMMDKKERHELKRKLRRAEGSEDKITWRLAGRAALSAFLDMMALDSQKARFLTAAMRAQFDAVAAAAEREGWLQLAFLDVNGVPAAAYLNFDFGNRLWIYNSAIDQRFSGLSAGWVLLGFLLRWAIDNRRAAFDFMRGGEDYKFRFGATAGHVVRLQLSPALTVAELGGQPAAFRNDAEVEYFPQ
jgi:CelD/BcsL family acetyltransferase involved in cellulose biosynthesis